MISQIDPILILSGLVVVFFITLAAFCYLPRVWPANEKDPEANYDNFARSSSKISVPHLLALGAIILALQVGQYTYTCDKQMNTVEEKIIIRP
jgi:hypothetical protein